MQIDRNNRREVMNQLKEATSPYLQQHANNPVDWFECGAKALDKSRHEQVEEIASQVATGLQHGGLGVDSAPDTLNVALLDAAYQATLANFDPINGGLSKGRPKFPNPMSLEFALRTAVNMGDQCGLSR